MRHSNSRELKVWESLKVFVTAIDHKMILFLLILDFPFIESHGLFFIFPIIATLLRPMSRNKTIFGRIKKTG